MQERSQTVYYIEKMQPAWLGKYERRYRLVFGLVFGLGVGLVFGLVLGLLVGLLWFGGLGVVQHISLCWFLARYNYLPRRPTEFLDAMAGRILLRKVGGGYIFIHRLLLEYFASLEEGA